MKWLDGMRWIWTLSRLRKRKMSEWSPELARASCYRLFVPLPPSGLNIPMPPCKPPRTDEYEEIARVMVTLFHVHRFELYAGYGCWRCRCGRTRP